MKKIISLIVLFSLSNIIQAQVNVDYYYSKEYLNPVTKEIKEVNNTIINQNINVYSGVDNKVIINIIDNIDNTVNTLNFNNYVTERIRGTSKRNQEVWINNELEYIKQSPRYISIKFGRVF